MCCLVSLLEMHNSHCRQNNVVALQCHKGELPELDTVDQYTGIFLTGSHCSAKDPEQWIQKEAEWLRSFAQRQTPCKLVASCFGCQVVYGLS